MDIAEHGTHATRDPDGWEAPGEAALPPRQVPLPSGSAHLCVNLTVDRRFDFRFLFRLVSLAIRYGGMLERCDAAGAEFAFPQGSVADFMGEIGSQAPVRRTVVSPRERGGSRVSVRFRS